MKVRVDHDACEANAVCMGIAPEVFEVDDDDTMTVLDESPPETERSKVHAAVEACPVLALSLVG